MFENFLPDNLGVTNNTSNAALLLNVKYIVKIEALR